MEFTGRLDSPGLNAERHCFLLENVDRISADCFFSLYFGVNRLPA